MLDTRTSTRPTKQRLLVAMAISACFILLVLTLLGMPGDFVVDFPGTGFERRAPLTVHIKSERREVNSDVAADSQHLHSTTEQEAAPLVVDESQQEVAAIEPHEPPAESMPVRDWNLIASETAKSIIGDSVRQEQARESMWRQTHSVMFKPGEKMLVENNESVFSGLEFRQYSRVLGLGLNIGSCFIGIPLAGVPVEKRQAAITLFVCS